MQLSVDRRDGPHFPFWTALGMPDSWLHLQWLSGPDLAQTPKLFMAMLSAMDEVQ